MTTVNQATACLEMFLLQEGSINFVKCMEMKVTIDFHFWTLYLRGSERTFIHAVGCEIHICGHSGHLLLILLLCPMVPGSLAGLL